LKKLIIISIWLLPLCNLFAQTNGSSENSYFLDDGGISNSKNLLKVNVLSIVNGDLPFYYERVLSKSFSVEIGAGILLPYYLPELPRLITNNENEIVDPAGGYSLWIQPKYYIQGKSPELRYFGLQFRKRNYNLKNGVIITYDLSFITGTQLIFAKRMALDLSIGLGIHSTNKNETDIFRFNNYLTIPVAIKLGYLF